MKKKKLIPPNNYDPISGDPVRRLYAAVVEQVVRDIFDPPASLSKYDRLGAVIFLFDDTFEDYLLDAGVSVPWQAIRQTYHQREGTTC